MLFIKETLDKNYDNSSFLRDEIPQSKKIIVNLIKLLIDIVKSSETVHTVSSKIEA